jgi:magnesium chelatase family protein
MLARCSGSALRGLEAVEVNVEVDIAPGLPGLQLVGLPDAAVQEARERVRAALRNSGLRVPLTRVVVSLAPADLRKAGPGFDLPIALGLLVASGQMEAERLAGIWSAAELGLDGRCRPVRGVLAMAMAAHQAGARGLVVAAANVREAALVEGLAVWGAQSLTEVLQILNQPAKAPVVPATVAAATRHPCPDLMDVRGAEHGRRALEIAAAGGHHLLLVGAAGSGKTMLAKRLPGLLPPLERSEALEVTRLHSVAGLLAEDGDLISQRPFRAPHHSCSGAALIGGGSLPVPGELSLAHHGVLFLDELAEFRRDTLDLLRQPLEEGEVLISRARQRCRFPCRVTLIAATNPCPCGRYGDGDGSCECGEGVRLRYWGRLSGPLLDRLDLQVVMRRPSSQCLTAPFRSDQARIKETLSAADLAKPETSAVVARRVRQARQRMAERNPGRCTNAALAGEDLVQTARLTPEAGHLWQRAIERRRLSARSGMRLLRVARTIADLTGERQTGAAAISEALSYRSFDLIQASAIAGSGSACS